MEPPSEYDYEEIKRRATDAYPRDAEHLDRLEQDIKRCTSLESLIETTEQALKRLVFWRSRKAALRLRDSTVVGVVPTLIQKAGDLKGLFAVRRAILGFPFANDDLRERSRHAFDADIEDGCMALIEMADRDHLPGMRSILIEFPYIDPNTLKRVLELLAKKERALTVRLH